MIPIAHRMYKKTVENKNRRAGLCVALQIKEESCEFMSSAKNAELGGGIQFGELRPLLGERLED